MDGSWQEREDRSSLGCLNRILVAVLPFPFDVEPRRDFVHHVELFRMRQMDVERLPTEHVLGNSEK